MTFSSRTLFLSSARLAAVVLAGLAALDPPYVAIRLCAQEATVKPSVMSAGPTSGAAQMTPAMGPNNRPMPTPGAGGQPPGAAAAKPGETPGKPADKKPEGPKPITRPTKPAAPPKPEELKVRPGKDGKVLGLSFNGQPWDGVLNWLAENSGMSLDWQELPGDPYNLSTRKSYTVAEVRDLINRDLLARGYTLLRFGERMTVVKVKDLDASLVPRIEPEELAGRDPHEFVKVCFALDWFLGLNGGERTGTAEEP